MFKPASPFLFSHIGLASAFDDHGHELFCPHSFKVDSVMHSLSHQDPEILDLINAEAHRQQDGLEMIASENYTSPAVMQAVGSVLTNKYAEGYPGRRYYGGCEYVDVVEDLARDRAKQLFGAEHANVQPHSRLARPTWRSI